MMVCGYHPVHEALRSDPGRIHRIWITRDRRNPRIGRIIRLAREKGVRFDFQHPAWMKNKAGDTQHQHLIAEISEVHYLELADLLKGRRLLMLDHVEDPHNLGAILRTADGAGIDGVILPRHRACSISSAVVRTSAGAALHIPAARVGNLAYTLKHLKEQGFQVIGLDGRGVPPPVDFDPDRALVVVVGNESKGLGRLLIRECDQLVSLPMRGRLDSLNLSVAAGIFLYELLR